MSGRLKRQTSTVLAYAQETAQQTGDMLGDAIVKSTAEVETLRINGVPKGSLAGNPLGINDVSGGWLLDILKHNSTLKTLDVSHNKLGAKTAQAFRRNFNDHDGMKGNRNLTTLKMHNCCLNDECFQYLAKGLMSTKSLELVSMDLTKNWMTPKGCDYMHATLKKRNNLTNRLRITAKGQTGIKDLLVKDMIEDWWKKNEQERMNTSSTSAAESSMATD